VRNKLVNVGNTKGDRFVVVYLWEALIERGHFPGGKALSPGRKGTAEGHHCVKQQKKVYEERI